MSQTIGKRVPKSRPEGDYEALCSYCGVVFYRSQLHKDATGSLACPDEGNGRDLATLSELEAQAAAEYDPFPDVGPPRDGVTPPADDALPTPFIPAIGQYP